MPRQRSTDRPAIARIRRYRILAMTLALLGSALVGTGLLSQGGERAYSAADFGAPESSAAAALAPPVRAAASGPSSPPPKPGSAATPSRRPISRAAGTPVLLTVPGYRVQAAVVPVVSSPAELGVPADPRRVGWWIASALPGSARGTTVIDGHVDSASVGIGALAVASRLRAGDRITLRTDTAATIRYRVYARRSYPKRPGLPPTLFTASGPARLVLITCGGPFDAAAKSYLDNIVVFATPE